MHMVRILINLVHYNNVKEINFCLPTFKPLIILSFLLNLGINDEQFDRDDQFRPNYNIGSKIWSFPLDNRQHLSESPIHILVDNTPMQFQGTHPRWILVKKRKNKRNVIPGDEDTRTNGFISEAKRSSGKLNAFSGRMCESLLTTGNYITRAICKMAFGEAFDESNQESTSGNIKPSNEMLQPRTTFIRTARSNRNTAQISTEAKPTGRRFLKLNSESNEPHGTKLFVANDQIRTNYDIGNNIWSSPLDKGQHLPESPILIPVDKTPIQYQGTNPRRILVKNRRSKRSIMPGDEDTKIIGSISESKRSPGTLNALGGRLCQSLVITGNYITRAICKVAYGEADDVTGAAIKHTNVLVQPRTTFLRTARSNTNTADISTEANWAGQSLFKTNSESNERRNIKRMALNGLGFQLVDGVGFPILFNELIDDDN